MPSKKRLPTSGRSPRWQVILEKIESENRLTAEALERFRQTVDQRFDHMEQQDRERDALFATALRDVKTGLEAKIDARLQVVETKVEKVDARLQVVETKVDRLEVKVDKIDARLQTVEIKVDTLVPLEGRVSALERRPA